MSLRDVQLQSLTTGKKLKTFSVLVDGQPCLYFGDDEATDNLDKTQPYNKYSMYDLYHGHIVHNMYRNDKLRVRSTTRMKHDEGTVEDFLNIYLPNLGRDMISKVVQHESYTYVLTKPTVRGFTFKNEGLEYSRDIDTMLYQQALPMQDAQPGMPYASMLSSGWAVEDVLKPKFRLQNIPYNYVIEIPNEYLNGFFDDATILGDGINTKNHLGYDYRMHMVDTADMSKIQVQRTGQIDLSYDGVKCNLIDVAYTQDGYYFETNFAVYMSGSLLDAPAVVEPATVYDKDTVVKDIYDGVLKPYSVNADVSCVLPVGNYRFVFQAGPSAAKVEYPNFVDEPDPLTSKYVRVFKTENYVFLQTPSRELFALNQPNIDPEQFRDQIASDVGTNVLFDVPLEQDVDAVYCIPNGSHVRYFLISGKSLYASDMDVYNSFTLQFKSSGDVLKFYGFDVQDEDGSDDVLYLAVGAGGSLQNAQFANIQYSHDYMRFSFESTLQTERQIWRDVNFGFSGAIVYVESSDNGLKVVDSTGGVYSIGVEQFSKYVGNMASFNIIFDKNRIYTDIKKHGNELYLKYVTTARYELDNIVVDESEYKINMSLSSLLSADTGKVFQINCLSSYASDEWADSYQKIESIASINRFKLAQHKSNAYSIEITDSGVNSADMTDKEREMIKRDVESNIRDIIKTVSPANTQFIGIRWSGK